MSLDSIISQTSYEPRSYQKRIITKTADMFMGRHRSMDNTLQPALRSVMIESPTGSGKTCMALLGAKALQNEIPDLAIGWVAMRHNLLTQAKKENFEKKVNLNNVHFISMFENNPKKIIEQKKAGRKILVVCDESHHDSTTSMSHLHNVIKPDFILGMTATTFRTDRMKLCFDAVVKDAGIHQLIQEGYLSPYHHYSIPKWDAETVADHYCADPKRWGKSIFYFVSLNECFNLSSIFHARGIKHDVVTGDSDCSTQLQAFRDGEHNCLINCMKLTEGFDEPALQTAWVRDSCRGPTMQMGGRVFRKHKDLPFKQIVQSTETSWPFMRTAMPIQSYVWQNDSWLTLKANPQMNLISQNVMFAIANTNVELPSFILKKQKVARKIRF